MVRFKKEGAFIMAGRLFIAAAIAGALPSEATAQDEPHQCDSVLVEQVVRSDSSFDWLSAWSNLVDQSSFNRIKAGGSSQSLTPAGWFDGDFNAFREKRRKHLQKESRTETLSESREEYKSYLTPDQIDAWVKCKTGVNEVALYYKNVDANSATIVLKWLPTALAGPLREVSRTIVSGGKSTTDQIPAFQGSTQFIVTRERASDAIRGVVTGIAGVGNVGFADSVYIPPFIPEVFPDQPEPMIVPRNGVVLTSIATWRGGKALSTTCEFPPESFDLVVVSTSARKLGRSLGRCTPRGKNLCDSKGEACTDIVITSGCLVSREWHNWYKAVLRRGVGTDERPAARALPYSAKSVCFPEPLD